MNVQPLHPEGGLAPPQDIDAETYVLSACILKSTLYDVVAGVGLTAQMFYADRHRLIFAAIAALHSEGAPIDVGTVFTRLRDSGDAQRAGGSPYLAQLVDATPAVLDTHVEAYARTVRDKYRLRSMVATLKQRAAEGFGTIDDVQRYLDEVEASVSDIARSYEGRRGLVHILGPTERAFSAVSEASRTGKPPGQPFGFGALDRKTRGMGEGDLIVVAGRPGMGKTAFVLGIAAQTAMGRSANGESHDSTIGAVAFFSLEMSAEQLALRCVCGHERLDSKRITSGMVRGDEWPKIASGVDAVAKMPIWIDDTPAVSVADVRSRSRKLQADLARERQRNGHGPALRMVVIDYLQLMGAPATSNGRKRFETREQEVAGNTRACKQLAKELKCPVLLLSQLNRGVESRTTKDKRPKLSDLRESGAVEQDADTVMFLYRDEYYDEDSPDRGVAEVIVAKQRNGPTGTVKLRFTPEYTRFDDLADQDDFDDFDDFADAGAP